MQKLSFAPAGQPYSIIPENMLPPAGTSPNKAISAAFYAHQAATQATLEAMQALLQTQQELTSLLQGVPLTQMHNEVPSEKGERSTPLLDETSPLKYYRMIRGWSQQDVADELYRRCSEDGKPDVALNVNTISKWERGINKPSPLYRKHFCLLYGVTARALGFL